MVKKDADRTVNILPVPLDAEAYVVNVDLTDAELRKLRLQWEKMNSAIGTKRILLVLPEKMKFEQVPSSILRDWVDRCAGVLESRGELDERDKPYSLRDVTKEQGE